MGILAAAALEVLSTYQRNKGKCPGQLLFGCDMILPINHIADWKYILQSKQAQIEKYAIYENSTRINHNYRVGDQVMIGNKTSFKYETPFKGCMKLFKC